MNELQGGFEGFCVARKIGGFNLAAVVMEGDDCRIDSFRHSAFGRDGVGSIVGC